MTVSIPEDLNRYASMGILSKLLVDHSARGNIVWATTAYEHLGEGYMPVDEIQAELITDNHSGIIRRRARKDREEQSLLTRKHAEVFTPAYICSMMIDYADSAWMENLGIQRIEDSWQEYVSSQRMEITCGEAPYLANRYDAETGDEAPEIETRIGILDRKLKVISNSVHQRQDWIHWAIKATESTYGYEYQGDNLLIARINILRTIEDHLSITGFDDMSEAEYEKFANIISWNIWQMDGLSYKTAERRKSIDAQPLMLFDLESDNENQMLATHRESAKIRNWDTGKVVVFDTLLSKRKGRTMKFDYIIGNPPYQEETNSDSTRMPPIYNFFMDQCYQIASKVELITPARFLFDAGYTPHEWNMKMLNDEHFKVIRYVPESDMIFNNTDIKGGVCISYRDMDKIYKPIRTFVPYNELQTILTKVTTANIQINDDDQSNKWVSEITYPALSYQLSNTMLQEHPNTIGRLRTSAFEKLSVIFHENLPKDSSGYIEMIGLLKGKRTLRFVRRDYLKGPDNLDKWKVILPKSNGSGALGETFSSPLIGKPQLAHTQTFISIGSFDKREDAENCLKYIKSKFARVLLGIMKTTQDNPPTKWRYVPIQNFSSDSDIDWSKSIPEIDAQLYAKYGLDEHEIEFIETHVKEMD